MTSRDLLPENISEDTFKELLEQYPALIEAVSSRKTSKPGQKTLVELDDFRYNEAVKLFSSNPPKRAMNHDDVKVLVEWKLGHGKFRPTLMKLVSSNDEATVEDTIEGAISAYRRAPDAHAALKEISKLKGIGPATASLLLSVHDPESIIFFSDEAFWWLCCGGKKAPIKYNPKEYQELNQSAQSLVKRLKVGATDVEKVAYVVLNGEEPSTSSSEKPGAAAKPTQAEPKERGKKRKENPENLDPPEQSVRRSKRGKMP